MNEVTGGCRASAAKPSGNPMALARPVWAGVAPGAGAGQPEPARIVTDLLAAGGAAGRSRDRTPGMGGRAWRDAHDDREESPRATEAKA
jgi:hypothetical protein